MISKTASKLTSCISGHGLLGGHHWRMRSAIPLDQPAGQQQSHDYAQHNPFLPGQVVHGVNVMETGASAISSSHNYWPFFTPVSILCWPGGGMDHGFSLAAAA